jgi:hypothetical protein
MAADSRAGIYYELSDLVSYLLQIIQAQLTQVGG